MPCALSVRIHLPSLYSEAGGACLPLHVAFTMEDVPCVHSSKSDSSASLPGCAESCASRQETTQLSIPAAPVPRDG